VNIERDPYNDAHLKIFNRSKPMVIDFDNDDWIYDPNLCGVERFEIDKMSSSSSSYYSENREYSIDHSQNEEDDCVDFQNDEKENDLTNCEINEKDEDEYKKNDK